MREKRKLKKEREKKKKLSYSASTTTSFYELDLMELPDTRFFDACLEGDEAYVDEALNRDTSVCWERTFRIWDYYGLKGVC